MTTTEVYTVSLHDALPIFGEIRVLCQLDEIRDLRLDVVDHRIPDARGIHLAGGERGDHCCGVHGDFLDVLDGHSGFLQSELDDHVSGGAFRNGDLFAGQVVDRLDVRLGDHAVGLTDAVDGDHLGLARSRQPHRTGADIPEVQVTGSQSLDLQRPVGEGLQVCHQAVLFPQA